LLWLNSTFFSDGHGFPGKKSVSHYRFKDLIEDTDIVTLGTAGRLRSMVYGSSQTRRVALTENEALNAMFLQM
jgi:hypothetical protein